MEPTDLDDLDRKIDESQDVAESMPTSASGSRERPGMSAREAIEKLQRGEVVAGVKISRLCLKGNFPSPVRFDNVTLIRPKFEKANFAEPVVFEHCVLDQPRFNAGTTFAKGLDFKACELFRPNFRKVTVIGLFQARRNRFQGGLQAVDSRFEGKVRLFDARFHGWSQWDRCEFAAEADFRSVHVEEGLVFHDCHFAGPALFRGASVEKKFEPIGTQFDGLLDLSKSKLNDYVYLEQIKQGEGMRFAFDNAVAERILVRPSQVEGRLEAEESGNYVRAAHEYAFLKRVYGGLHAFEHEDWAFYRFKVNRRKAATRSWARPWTKLAQFCDWLFLDLGCGYGTNPLRAVVAAALIMLVFGLIFMAGVTYLRVEQPPFPDQPVTSLGNRLLIGLLTSVSAFTAGLTNIRDAAQSWMNIPLIVESLLGTLLWGLFIVAFSRKVIR